MGLRRSGRHSGRRHCGRRRSCRRRSHSQNAPLRPRREQTALLEAAAAACGLSFDLDDDDDERIATLSSTETGLVVDVTLSSTGDALTTEIQLAVGSDVLSLKPEAAAIMVALHDQARNSYDKQEEVRRVLAEVSHGTSPTRHRYTPLTRGAARAGEDRAPGGPHHQARRWGARRWA